MQGISITGDLGTKINILLGNTRLPMFLGEQYKTNKFCRIMAKLTINIGCLYLEYVIWKCSVLIMDTIGLTFDRTLD